MNKQANRVRLTAGRVAALTCPADKSPAFLWDTDAPTLALRVTPTGRKTYVFESRLHGATVRITIGTFADWGIEQARTEARRLAVMMDSGIDPREVERQQQATKAAEKLATAAKAATVGEAWAVYLADRRPYWGDRHAQDHEKLTRAGGETARRGTRGRGKTIAGPLHPLMAIRLPDLTATAIEAWAIREGKTRPTTARLAWRLLRAFLSWCAEHPTYSRVVPDNNPAKTRRTREALGKAGVKKDALLKEQLPVWFDAVRAISNPAIAAYLQILLLTGARPGEVLEMQWADINTQWKGLTIRDKVEGERVIPLTPYVHQLLDALPRRSKWVFSSTVQRSGKPAQPISKPHRAHTIACRVAGIEKLTFHGLRRSFKSLTEWLEIPAGVVAQIQGHKPSATAEKHYTVRPLDLLRLHHERIEAWVLEQAKVRFVPQDTSHKLQVVTA